MGVVGCVCLCFSSVLGVTAGSLWWQSLGPIPPGRFHDWKEALISLRQNSLWCGAGTFPKVAPGL